MAVPQILVDLDAEVTKAVAGQASAAVLIRGINARLEAAVAAALAKGATEAELAPVQAVINALKTGTDDLAAAVAENPA